MGDAKRLAHARVFNRRLCRLAIAVLCAVLGGIAIATRTSAQNPRFDPNCTGNQGQHSWLCGGNGRCVSCFQCSACAPDTTACGSACCGAGQSCIDANQSLCSCPPGNKRCGGTCVNLQDDPRNCGACGVACDAPSWHANLHKWYCRQQLRLQLRPRIFEVREQLLRSAERSRSLRFVR